MGQESILELLLALLPGATETATLASLGVDDEDLFDLWEAVCEEVAERTVGPDIELEELGTAMTLQEAASAMAELLGGDRDDDDD